jgi:hypothetical protein
MESHVRDLAAGNVLAGAGNGHGANQVGVAIQEGLRLDGALILYNNSGSDGINQMFAVGMQFETVLDLSCPPSDRSLGPHRKSRSSLEVLAGCWLSSVLALVVITTTRNGQKDEKEGGKLPKQTAILAHRNSCATSCVGRVGLS